MAKTKKVDRLAKSESRAAPKQSTSVIKVIKPSPLQTRTFKDPFPTRGIGRTEADKTFFQTLRVQLKGENRPEQPYRQHAYVYACIRAIAQNISSVPWKIYTGTTEKPEVMEKGPIYELFRNPNPWLSRYQLWEATLTHLETSGECVWVLEKEKGKETKPESIPTEIWPFNGKNFEPIFATDDKTKAQVPVGWRYKSGKDEMTFSMAQIVFFKYFNPYNLYRGLSPIEAAQLEIDSDWNAARYNEAFFENSADPGGVLIYEPKEGNAEPLKEDQKTQIRENWEARHKGPTHAKRIAILEGGLKYQQTEISHSDMQFIEQRKWGRETICAVFKVPKFEITIYEDLNFATSKSADKNFWTKTLIPKMNYITDVIDSKCFKYWEGDKFWGGFDTSVVDALQADLKDKIENAQKLFGMMVPFNEINKKLELGFPETEWGKIAFVPFNLVPVTSLINQETPPPSKTPSEENPKGETEITIKDVKLKFWERYATKILDPNEKKFKSKIERYIFELRNEQLKRLDENSKAIIKMSKDDIEKILFVQAEWDKRLKDMTKPLYQTIMSMAGEELANEMGGAFEFNINDPAMIKFLAEKLVKLAKVNDTIREQVRSALVAGIAEDESVSQLASRIKTEFGFASGRSFMIARTETSEAANGTRFNLMQEEGVKTHEWITAGDEYVRESHIKCQQVGAVDVGDPFPNGLLYPGDINGEPGEVINCRCIAVATISS